MAMLRTGRRIVASRAFVSGAQLMNRARKGLPPSARSKQRRVRSLLREHPHALPEFVGTVDRDSLCAQRGHGTVTFRTDLGGEP